MKLDKTGRAARVRELARRARREGARASAARLALRAHDRLKTDGLGFLLPEDVADSSALELPPGRTLRPGEKATVGWICSPPHPGSGGHTTLFRMVAALERRGHRCVLFLYDAHRGDFERQAAVVRQGWPELRAEIRDATAGISGVDACVASAWESAHVLARRGVGPMHRFYFIQDFEPFFYPRGSHYALATDSYRFGFRMISLGGSVAELLRSEVGVSSEVVPFGCDTDVYRLLDPPQAQRSGVVFFVRPNVPRRGFVLGSLALAAFHELHPEQEIHLYGDRPPPLPFPATSHGRLTPSELNALYNRTLGGLALSFTNVTLVAEEMLASGNVPVANRSPYSRGGLDNEHVVWADPTPQAVARALADVVEHADTDARARKVSESVVGGWAGSQEQVADLVEDALWGRAR